MILRRLADALREQNWFTVVLEIAIVVVGIFIGLQVDNWNDARNERAEERAIIERLHGELETSFGFMTTISARQQNAWASLRAALDVVYGRDDQTNLGKAECDAIGRSGYLTMVTVDLPSLDELISSGRVVLLQDIDLRLALARLKQLAESSRSIFASARVSHLFVRYPDLVHATGYWSEQEDEVRLGFECDLAGMRANRAFQNEFSLNADSFDGFYNKGVRQELDQLTIIHQLVDQFLGIEHAQDTY